jgi:hypothetical protein
MQILLKPRKRMAIICAAVLFLGRILKKIAVQIATILFLAKTRSKFGQDDQ